MLRERGERRFEQLMGNLLRLGVLSSAAVVLAGAVVYLVRHGGSTPHYQVFRGEPGDLRSLPGILRDAASFQGRGLIQLGLLLLIATPIARVLFSVIAFLRERDWLYIAFTLIVLGVLLYSLLGQH